MSQRGEGGGGRGLSRDRSGSKRKSQDNDVVEQILNTLKNQNKLLKSLDARIGSLERQGQQLEGPQAQQMAPQVQAAIQVVHGSWKFQKSSSFKTTLAKVATDDVLSKKENAFGNANDEGSMLTGEAYLSMFGKSNWRFDVTEKNGMYSHPSIRGGFQALEDGSGLDSYIQPAWGADNFCCVRNLLHQVVFNDKADFLHKSGIYTLVVKYNGSDTPNQDAGIIVGEMEFNSKGYALAPGTDWGAEWHGLLRNKSKSHRTRGMAMGQTSPWFHRKISEPWLDGDEIKFTVDTNEDIITFQKCDSPEKRFCNARAFTTNNPRYPGFLWISAYCGGGYRDRQGIEDDVIDVKLTIMT